MLSGSGLAEEPAADKERGGAVPGRAEPASWSLDSIPHERIPQELSSHHAGVFFLNRGLSEHGCSPTKVGEYWAMGLPAVVSAGVSDLDAIVQRHRVGVVVPGADA